MYAPPVVDVKALTIVKLLSASSLTSSTKNEYNNIPANANKNTDKYTYMDMVELGGGVWTGDGGKRRKQEKLPLSRVVGSGSQSDLVAFCSCHTFNHKTVILSANF